MKKFHDEEGERGVENPAGEPKAEPNAEPNAPLTDLVLGVAFVLGGIYMIFAFSSFLVFLIGFGCAVFGASSLAKALSSSEYGESVGIPAHLRRSLPSPEKEREILRAVKESGEGVSPAEAAIIASIPVREADEILSGLAGRGYLEVESERGALFYSIPRRGGSLRS